MAEMTQRQSLLARVEMYETGVNKRRTCGFEQANIKQTTEVLQTKD
jgi:hypothetical protein